MHAKADFFSQSNASIQHTQESYQKSREKYEREKIKVRNVQAALLRLMRVLHVLSVPRLTLHPMQAAPHNVLPVLARRAPEQEQQRLLKRLEVVVAVDGSARVQLDIAEHLRGE